MAAARREAALRVDALPSEASHRFVPAADPYRARPPGRVPIVIDSRPWGARTILGVWLFGMIGLVLFSQRVDLTGTRAPDGGACEARTAHVVVWTSDPVRVDLADVVRAEVDHGDGTSRVVLVTKQGRVPLTSVSESGLGDEKAAMVAAVDAFLADPSRARLDVSYGSRFIAHRSLFLALMASVALLSFQTRRVRVIVDRDVGAVRIVRPRFPVGTREEALGIDTISRAEVQEQSDSDGAAYRVTLILSDGSEVPLSTTYTSGREPKDKTAAAINAALAPEA
jgi:hypothetical protein